MKTNIPLSGRAVTLLCVSSLSVLSGAAIAPALPGIAVHFANAPQAPLLSRLVLTVPAIAIALLAPIIGILIDRSGRRIPLLIALMFYGLAGLAGLVLDDLTALLGSRIVLGFAVAAIMTISTTLAGDYYNHETRAGFFGMQTAVQGFAGLAFTLIAGMLAEISWRCIFILHGVAWLILPAAFRFLAEPRGEHAASSHAIVDPVGFPWAPVLPLYVLACVNSILFYLVPTQLPFVMNELGIASPTMIGLAIGTTPVLMTICSLNYGRIRRRLASDRVFAISFAVMAVGNLLLALAGHWTFVILGTAVVGVGMGFFLPNIVLTTMATSPEARRGSVASGLTSTTFLGQFLSPLIFYPVFTRFDGAATFLVGAACLSIITAMMLKPLYR